jgi:hypothetical protein
VRFLGLPGLPLGSAAFEPKRNVVLLLGGAVGEESPDKLDVENGEEDGDNDWGSVICCPPIVSTHVGDRHRQS